jgi:hypothetical protein
MAARLNYSQSNAFMTGFCAPINVSNKLCLEIDISIDISIFSVQLQTVDHSVRWSMKNAASCVKRCEMQDTPST